jgi:uncharacterized protein YgiB involved in biofilm formation
MKRSEAIRLVLMGAGLTAVVALSYCNDASDAVAAGAFENVDQCAASGKYTRDACQQAAADAAKEHLQSAPRFAKREDCEAEFGANACATLPGAAAQPGVSASSVFVPVMAGFLLANAVGSYRAQPLYRPCDGGAANPDPQCRRASGFWSGGNSGSSSGGRSFYTSSGTRIGQSTGEVSVERSTFSSRGSSATLSRGGFGARAAHAAS